jgi:hypothetical protein
VYIILFKFNVLNDEFRSVVIKCILIYLLVITVCIFDFFFSLILYPVEFSTSHGFIQCMTSINK